MRKKVIITVVLILCLAALIGGTSYLIFRGSSNPTFAVMFRINPYKDGYRCSGTGKIDVQVDKEKLKETPGFPEGEAGDLFLNLLLKDISTMGADISYSGIGKGEQAETSLKLSSGNGKVYESKLYKDGEKKWTCTIEDGKSSVWTENSDTNIENIIKAIDWNQLKGIRDQVVLTAQDENSSTFRLKVTGENAKSVLGTEQKKNLETLAGSDEFGQFVDNMNIQLEMKTNKKVNYFTPYVGLSNVKVSFTLPGDRIGVLEGGKALDKLSDEEKFVCSSLTLKASISIDFTYADVKVLKPAM